jgi:hypothetical protein
MAKWTTNLNIDIHNKLYVKGFEDNVHYFLKGGWFWLKHLFT